MKTLLPLSVISAGALLALSGVASGAATTPDNDGLDENPGNSFTQKWRQARSSSSTFTSFRAELVSGPSDFFMKGGWANRGFSATKVNDDRIDYVGSLGSDNIRFDVTFDSVQGTQSSNEQEFAWSITYFDASGQSQGGYLWSNYASDAVTASLLGVEVAELDKRGGGFGGDWFAMSNFGSHVIPTPPAALIGAAGLAGVCVRRRRNA